MICNNNHSHTVLKALTRSAWRPGGGHFVTVVRPSLSAECVQATLPRTAPCGSLRSDLGPRRILAHPPRRPTWWEGSVSRGNNAGIWHSLYIKWSFSKFECLAAEDDLSISAPGGTGGCWSIPIRPLGFQAYKTHFPVFTQLEPKLNSRVDTIIHRCC